ncbi:lipopolysaccharide biosynthesis protein [Parerythrobacter aurantius]|uniref:lipopolysaccharide biosynthesis protein n=1 Tax=Parerythrobacter aurantius TaxID=3127706 RepID=UPI003249326D
MSEAVSVSEDSKSTENRMLRSRLGSILHLLSGNMAVAVLMAASTAIAARALGPESYGVLALILTTGRIFERLIRFESWQPIIRFGTQPEIEGEPRALSQLFLLGLLLDIACALLAAALMLGVGYLILPTLGLDRSYFYLLAIFAPAIAFNIRGMPTAALRMAGKFKVLAYFQIFSAALRILLAVTAWQLDASIGVFLAIWVAAQLIDTMLFAALAARALKDLGVGNPLKSKVRGLLGQFPGFMRFAWSTNASSALRTATQEADTLLVGALAGPSMAGFYHLSKRFAKVAQQIGQQVQTVIYPDLARMWARGQFDSVKSVKTKTQLSLAAIGIVMIAIVAVIGERGVGWLFGKEYVAVFPLLVAQLVAVGLIMVAAPSRSTMLAMNRPGTVLVIAAISTVAFFVAGFALIPALGPLGANFAHILFGLVTVILLETCFWAARLSGDFRQAAAS